MMTLLRFLFQYRRMHRRISNQRKQLSDLNKALQVWKRVAELNTAAAREAKQCTGL